LKVGGCEFQTRRAGFLIFAAELLFNAKTFGYFFL
jgi:hypothetical protein